MDEPMYNSFPALGGLVDSKHRAVIFEKYRVRYREGEYWISPTGLSDNFGTLLDHFPDNTQQLLVDLCNLATSTQELLHQKATYEEIGSLVIPWCCSHIHPYYTFHKYYSPIKISVSHALDAYRASQEYFSGSKGSRHTKTNFDPDKIIYADIMAFASCYFDIPISEMIQDLQQLYVATISVLTILLLLDGEIDQARVMYKRIDNFQIMRKGFSRKYWQPDFSCDIMSFYQHGYSPVDIANMFFDSMPRLTLTLQMAPDSHSPVLRPEYNSIFDAAYHALQRLAVANTSSIYDIGGKNVLGICEACGQIYIKSGSRQKYCHRRTCQSIRNQRKSRAYYQRKQQNP